MSNLTGQTLGAYQLADEIGRGGMATVYRAAQPSVGREVAVKVLHPALMEQDPSINDRFRREVEIVARLQHPHILPVHDFGEHDGMPYIVMALLTGGTLADRIHQVGPLGLDETAQILRELADALDYAHSLDIIHRDFKPSNVLLDERGHAYLADFGLAKIISGSNLTASAGMVGTPDYMAPDWAKEDGVTHSVDIYALGVTLYQMLAGHVPFRASTPMGILMAHANEPVPDICAAREDAPAAARNVIETAMSKKPEERYASAGDLARAFQSALDATPVAPKFVRPAQPADAGGPYFYPNTWGRSMMEAVEQGLGSDTLNAVLLSSGLAKYLENFPPDNNKREFPFEDVSKFCETIYAVYGKRGAQAVSKVFGQHNFEAGLERFSGVIKIFEAMWKGLPRGARVKAGLEFMMRMFSGMSDQITELDEDDRFWYWRIIRCPVCWGWRAEEPVCFLATGVLDASIVWNSGAHHRIVETECIAKGDAACVFAIEKQPQDE